MRNGRDLIKSGYVPIGINFPTFMHPLGGWVFVVDVTRGSVGKFIPIGTYQKTKMLPIRKSIPPTTDPSLKRGRRYVPPGW